MRPFSETWQVEIYYYITTEFDYAKRDSRLAAYGGVVLQRFEFVAYGGGRCSVTNVMVWIYKGLYGNATALLEKSIIFIFCE